MAGVRYVILSDLHLGAAYSLLTGTNADGQASPKHPSPTLTSLAAGLKTVLADLRGAEPATLVLLGDVFDLSFAPARDTMMAFQRLAEAFFGGDDSPFAPTILYVPGNHDHREWRVMRDALFLDEVREQRGYDLPERPAVTPLLGPTVNCQVATALMRNALGSDRYRVESGYPNVAYASGDRGVVMHHGHFVEGTYRLASTVLGRLTGQPETTDIDELERINGPWIDFLWSSFGDQGKNLADGVFTLYEVMLDGDATHRLIEQASAMVLRTLGNTSGLHPNTKVGTHGLHVTVGGAVNAILDATFGRAAETERMSHDKVLSTSGLASVRWYLEGPVRAQLDRAAWPGVAPTTYSFIFGHTHKPFQDQLLASGYDGAIQIWNTGGWVVDHPTTSPVQGGAAVLVDDDANVASLRLFNDPINGEMHPVHAAGCHGPQDGANPLLGALQDTLVARSDAFAEFSAACHAGLDQRARWLRSRVEQREPVVDLAPPTIDLSMTEEKRVSR